jgi:3-methyl-2-oxobutanoate hydroxymethyltransferase
MLGYSTTIPVTLPQILHHTMATRAGVKRAFLVADLPFGSYQESVAQAVRSSVELMKAGAEAIKLEGEYLEAITAIAKAGIPVFGHIGYTPQSAFRLGNPKIQGKGEGATAVLESAKRIFDAGAIGIVLELIPPDLAKQISEGLDFITIGIGAGVHCSGQIQVLHDVLGLSPKRFKHSHQTLDGRKLVTDALVKYAGDVREAKVV